MPVRQSGGKCTRTSPKRGERSVPSASALGKVRNGTESRRDGRGFHADSVMLNGVGSSAQVHMLDIVHLAAEEASGQAFELGGGVCGIEAEGAMPGGRDFRVNRGPSTPFGCRKRQPHFAQDDSLVITPVAFDGNLSFVLQHLSHHARG